MNEDIIQTADRVIAGTYKRFPIVITGGKGSTLWDSEGNRYTDFVAGIAVCNLGHAHPRLVEAVSRQAAVLWHVSNLYYTVPQTRLAEWLTAHSFADRVFFCNSGAEANEAAIKLVRRYFKEKGEKDRYRIITLENSFHGRTMATLSATGQEKIRKGYEPVLEGFDFVPINDFDALQKAIGPGTCAAVMMEPIQGEGGVCCAAPDYMRKVRQMCTETGCLLVFDEIQTGMGRTGKLFAYEHYDIAPDIMTLAKALANGLPIGAMLAKEEIAAAFGPGAHASTFGGTPIVTSAAMETVRILEEEDLVGRCSRIGEYFKENLLRLKKRHDVIEEVLGVGLLLGIKLKTEGAPVVKKCMERGFLINCVQDTVLRFVPPLVIEKAEIDALVNSLDEVL